MRRIANRSLEKIYRLSELPPVSTQFADLPLLRGYVEEFSPVAPGRVHVTGWALSLDAPIRQIEVLYNGTEVQRTTLVDRADVAAHAPWLPHASKSGFGFTIDVANFDTTCGAGMLDIVGLAEDGRRVGYMPHMVLGDVGRFPTPPEDYQYRVTHTRNPHFYQIAAVRSFGDIIRLLNRHIDWHKIQNVFDWGCGCGRLSTHFLSAAGISLTGADIDSRAIKWCRSNLPEGRFHVLSPMPPTEYEDGEFDLIVAFSVFTHLRREVQEAWLHEMYRVLKPGGWFVATTHGQVAFQFASQNLAPDWPAGEFHDISDPTLDGVAPIDYYRGAYQTENYTRQEFGKLFQIVEYVPRGANGLQDLVLMRKSE
jgi:SAM-dependent methyltransferase